MSQESYGKSGRTIQLDLAGEQSELQRQLQELAREIGASLSALDDPLCKDLLGSFVSELFLSVTELTQRRDRRLHQAEKIAQAKRRGVQFGRTPKALPDNFYQCRDAWRSGELTLRQAAEGCNMPQSSFYDAVLRTERAV